jgi:hypothetical protein
MLWILLASVTYIHIHTYTLKIITRAYRPYEIFFVFTMNRFLLLEVSSHAMFVNQSFCLVLQSIFIKQKNQAREISVR